MTLEVRPKHWIALGHKPDGLMSLRMAEKWRSSASRLQRAGEMLRQVPQNALISVRDPIDEGEPIDPKDKDALFLGLLRLHIANLIKPLGHAELAGSLLRLTHQPFARRLQDDLKRARALLDEAPVREVDNVPAVGGLVGGIVTRTGPVTNADVSPADQEVLARLNLRPVFVGVERDVIRAAVEAEPQLVRSRLVDKKAPDAFARPDRAGGWIIPLGEERHIKDST